MDKEIKDLALIALLAYAVYYVVHQATAPVATSAAATATTSPAATGTVGAATGTVGAALTSLGSTAVNDLLGWLTGPASNAGSANSSSGTPVVPYGSAASNLPENGISSGDLFSNIDLSLGY